MLSLGVIASSRKENEKRLPIHPDHFELIPQELRGSIRFETGYGEPFGVSDEELSRLFGGVTDRDRLISASDVVLLPKPLAQDLQELKEGGVLWGWPHCVQQRDITQTAIDRRLTLIAWEAMFTWRRGMREMHIFERNNEMAGYCGVIHALGLVGQDGLYGPPSRACVLSHGSVSRGAIFALQGRGFADITVYTRRPPWAVHDKIVGCRYGQMVDAESGEGLSVVEETGIVRPMPDALSQMDVIVNGILQNTDHPLMYLAQGEESRLNPGALIVDVSCDLAMGFPFARPTSFEEPSFPVGHATYYAVDHTPTYCWKSASWELSRALSPFIETVMSGPEAWEQDETVKRSIEICDGVIQNQKVLGFQNRSPDYPHAER